MNPPAFQFYASDFLASTADMTAEEVGVHIRLLCHQWMKGGLPNEDARLASMAGQCQASSLAYARSRFGICQDGMLRHPRLEIERQKQQEFREKQARNGAKRWSGNAKPHAVAMPSLMPTHMPNACSPSPSPSPKEMDIHRESPAPANALWPTLPEVLRVASMRGIPSECAEAWWLVHDARGGLDTRGQPIVRWEPSLTAYWASWRANETKDRLSRPNGRRGKPESKQIQEVIEMPILGQPRKTT